MSRGQEPHSPDQHAQSSEVLDPREGLYVPDEHGVGAVAALVST